MSKKYTLKNGKIPHKEMKDVYRVVCEIQDRRQRLEYAMCTKRDATKKIRKVQNEIGVMFLEEFMYGKEARYTKLVDSYRAELVRLENAEAEITKLKKEIKELRNANC